MSENEAATAEPQAPDDSADIDWKAKSREWERRAKENSKAAARLAEIEDEQKTESQKAAEQLASAQRDADQARLENLRYKVGITAGLTPELIVRLQGTTEDELTADAVTLQSFVRPNTPAPATAPQPAPVSGVVPPQDQAATSGEQLFRQILSGHKA